MSRFKELALLWEKNGGRSRGSSKEDSKRKVEGPALLGELLFFFHMTGDKRFGDAIAALIECGAMQPDGQWRRGWISPIDFDIVIAKVEFFEDLVRHGFSKRQAAAEIAARLPVRALSFDAAVKQILSAAERVGELVGEKKSNDIG